MTQIPIHSENFARLRGKEARRQNLHFATIAASRIASTLGPSGAYKMIVYNKGPERVVKVTKNAVEILSELEVQYPAVKTIAEAARIHREQVGEGVSTFVILLARLLKEAETLTERRVHTSVVLRGYRAAALKALALIEE